MRQGLFKTAQTLIFFPDPPFSKFGTESSAPTERRAHIVCDEVQQEDICDKSFSTKSSNLDNQTINN